MDLNNKQKGILSILLAMSSAFLIGIDTTMTIYNIKTIEPTSWLLTSGFGIMWIVLSVNYLTKKD